MAQYATVEDFATHIQVTDGDPPGELSAADAATAEQLLVNASAVVSAYCTAVSLELITDDVITIRGRYESELPLPRGPVVSVDEVQIDGDVVEGWILVKDTLIRSTTSEATFTVGYSHWGGDGVEVQVTYTHGYATPPGEVKAVVLDMAARSFRNPSAFQQRSIGTYSEAFAADGRGLMLTETEKSTLRRHRRTAQAARV